MAERKGFEPPDPWGSTVFKTAAFDRSATSPKHSFTSGSATRIRFEQNTESTTRDQRMSNHASRLTRRFLPSPQPLSLQEGVVKVPLPPGEGLG